MTNIESFLRRRAVAATAFATSARDVMTRDEAMTMGETLLGLAQDPDRGIKIDHKVVTILRVTRNTQISCAVTDQLAISFSTHLGSDQWVVVPTNVRDLGMLRRVIQHAQTRATPRPHVEGDESSDDLVLHIPPRTYMPVSLWHESTNAAMREHGGETAARVIAAIRSAIQTTPLTCAATIAFMTRAKLRLRPPVITAWGEDTDAEITVTARTPDNLASGWSGATHRDWTQMHLDAVVRNATEMAIRSRGAVRVEPGRYTTIFSPDAIGAIVGQMGFFFDAESQSPLNDTFPVRGHLSSKLGTRIVDERITMSTDPSDPVAGSFPFFEDHGYPSGAATWIDRGIFTAQSISLSKSMETGKRPIQLPQALRMSGGPTSIEQMITQCDRGIYVNRLSNVQIVDARSASMVGNTRDGCFLIERGRIKHPITNLRFQDSPFFMFNRLLALGTPRRAAFGFTPPNAREARYWQGWPRAPIVVPPVMIKDFNFVALADAV